MGNRYFYDISKSGNTLFSLRNMETRRSKAFAPSPPLSLKSLIFSPFLQTGPFGPEAALAASSLRHYVRNKIVPLFCRRDLSVRRMLWHPSVSANFDLDSSLKSKSFWFERCDSFGKVSNFIGNDNHFNFKVS